MRIFDGHCDVLYKMWDNKSILFENSKLLQVNFNYLTQYDKTIQCFAIYIPEEVTFGQRFSVCLKMIDIFYEKIIKPFPEIKLVTSKNDIENLADGEIGAILTLEGCEAIGDDITKLRTLYRLGVASVGLTWNYANFVADGIRELRGAGLTNFGREVVEENNKWKIWTDVSHLSEQSFWDTIEIADYPIASHSNAYDICSHPRNLKNAQIQALIEKNGVMGITFVPFFIERNGHAKVSDLLHHIDHICSLGGEKNIGLGSDFDGASERTENLEDYSQYYNLIELLLKHYSYTQVINFCSENFVRRFPK